MRTPLLRQSLKMVGRDWRAGELRLLALALVVAVAAITAVGFLVDRIEAGLSRDAAQLIGADVVVVGDQPVDAAFGARAAALGLRTAETVTFPSMALADGAGERTLLVAVKAVSPGYPLRGALRVQDAPGAPDRAVTEVPPRGTAWVDSQVLQSLGLSLPGRLRLGELDLRVERVIAIEPDRGTGFVSFAPRVMIHLDDLPATQLVQPGSRLTYRLLAAGEAPAVRRFNLWAADHVGRGQQLESLAGGRPEMQRTIERAQRFLSLVALLAAMIAAVAVAVAARRFTLRHLDACALMRCLGVSQRGIVALFGLEFLWIGVAACAAGVVLGLASHTLMLAVLQPFIRTALPLPGALPAVQGFAVGVVLLLGFALPPLIQLGRVPPVRVLRRDLGAPSGGAALGYLLGVGGFAGLVLWSARDLQVGLMTAGGFAVGTLVFAAAAWGALRALSPLRTMGGGLGVSWRFAVAAVQRRPVAAVVQLVALAVGLMALLLLTVVRTDLVEAWRRAAPPDAPNRFVLNIQPEQVAPIAQRLHEAGVEPAPILPAIRGRLLAINERPVGPQDYANERARRLVDREFNLSTSEAAPSHNRIVGGRWYAPDARELSIEEGIAATLGIRLGDTLSFDIAGTRVTATATSLRKVNWDSLRANFFVLMPPRLLQDLPASYLSAFHLDPAQAPLAGELVTTYPNLTVIDTTVVLRQVQAMVDQVVAVVEFLFLFTLAAGVLVLYAALASSHDERVREAALLRALGASRRQLSRAQVTEMLCIGGLAGVLAAAGAAATGWALGRYAFEFEYLVSPDVFVLGIGGGVACALAGGWFGLRSVLSTPPLASLRDA